MRIRGFNASASLKLGRTIGVSRKRTGIRGFNASASLKRVAMIDGRWAVQRIRGFNASASLKLLRGQRLACRHPVSEALMPRPH